MASSASEVEPSQRGLIAGMLLLIEVSYRNESQLKRVQPGKLGGMD